MPTLLAIVMLGFFLGMRHATDPDHVVAVTTIVSRERTIFHAAVIGALWGIGHTVTILLVGSAIILLKLTIPPAIGLAMELAVAFMLMFLGVLNLTGLMARGIEWLSSRGYLLGAHAHVILGRVMLHTHDLEKEYMSRGSRSKANGMASLWGQLGLLHVLRPLMVGIVHGLAGSAAVTLLVLATITEPGWAIAYLLVFGIGTVVGMMLITAVLAFPFTYTRRRFRRLNHSLAFASGVISVSFGLFLCYQIGFSDGLFTGHPHWTPH